jgi:serine/threonine-protein kinase
MLHPERAATVEAERFLREIRLTAGFNHPHILPLLDSGETGGLLFSSRRTSAAVRSGSGCGTDHCRWPRQSALPVRSARKLEYAHRQRRAHRDVKPENILLSEGLAVIGDFGLARALQPEGPALTQTAFPVGTPGYMSPEQALGQTDLGPATDVLGLACVAYEMLVGAPPAMWVTEDVVRLGRFSDVPAAHRARLDQLPGRIEQVLARGLALRTADRYTAASDLADALAAAAEPGLRLGDQAVRAVMARAAALDAARRQAHRARCRSARSRSRRGIAPEHVREAVEDVVPRYQAQAIETATVPGADALTCGAANRS